jgi:outer membrane protein TolC
VQTAEQLLALRADLVACRAEAAAATAAIAQAQRRAEIAQAKIDALLGEKERLLRKLVASVE